VLRRRQDAFYVEGRDKGLNFPSEIAIAIARLTVARAKDADQRGLALNDLGLALQVPGERESGTARLEEAVAVYRNALKEYTRERVPLHWAMTQNNLGGALRTLGERESGTARLEEAIAAYRAAIKVLHQCEATYYHETTQENLAEAEAEVASRKSRGSS
jgi:exonuclease VII small subunit